nr:uncharacterized protein LOC106732382 [Pelodiscus sinensis]|eukprot:XP_014431687.1 uncharacterized protein LOC106732382 [Pelodiscus sinensis]
MAMLQFLQHLLPVAYILMLDMDSGLLVTLCMVAAAPVWLLHPTIYRRFWRLETSSDWWDQLVMEQWDDQPWLHNFRMHEATFFELCACLTPVLQRRDTHRWSVIHLQKRVAIALWKLATPDSYRPVANQFGVGKSITGAQFMQVVTAINSLLLCRVVYLQDLEATMVGFAALGFLNCGGAIDGMHIPIQAGPSTSLLIERATSQ